MVSSSKRAREAFAEQQREAFFFFYSPALSFSFPLSPIPQKNRNATVYVPYLNPQWNPVSVIWGS